MARTVLPIVGAVVGFYFGGPTGAQIGFALGGAVGGAVDPAVNRGPKIGEVGAQTSAEGAPRGIVYGTASVTGNVIATGPMIETTSVETQGKGGPVNETSVAYRSYAIRICEGPIGAVLRVWQDDKLVYDVRPGSLLTAISAKWLANKIFYLGTEGQLPDVFLALNVSGVGETPAYRGSAYMVVGLEDLTDRRGSIYQYRFEVAAITSTQLLLAPLSVGAWVAHASTGRPVSARGDTQYVGVDAVYNGTNFADATTASIAQAVLSQPSAVYATEYIGFTSSANAVGSPFAGGATLAEDAEFVYYQMSAGMPDVWENPSVSHSPYPLCTPIQLLGATVDDGKIYGIAGDGYTSFRPAKLERHLASPNPAYSYVLNNCINYPPDGVYFPEARAAYVMQFSGKRVPAPPAGYTRVPGVAKQLAAVEYRAGVLYQNGIGPVLAPGDPNYDNAAFWQDARDAAVLAGTMRAGVSAFPAIVDAYASGSGTATGEPVPLGTIVSDIHDRCGIPVDKFDVSELPDLVAGLVLAGDYTGADVINTLRGPYFFDKTEYDKKLWYPKRGKPVVLVLDIDDLVEEPDTSRREQAVEFPKKLHLFYQHAASGYAAVKATSSRSSPDARVVGELSVQIPVVMNEDQAAQTAQKLHKIAWAEAEGEVVLSVPESFIGLVPSDNIGLSLRGQVKRLRIEKMEYAAGIITLTMRHDRQSAYTSGVTGVPIPLPTPPPSTIVGSTTLAVMDIGARQDSEDDLHVLVAGVGIESGWYGWTLQRSLDAGANWTTVQSFGSAAVMGLLLDAVPAASEDTTDTTNTVRVQLYRDDQALEDLTAAQFLSEGGGFALSKADGSWEVMQYRDASEDSSGIFTLSTLHRGRLNSGASAHLAGAKFVALASAAHVVMESAWIGQAVSYRGVSLSQSPELAAVQTATYIGRSQLEWPVASLTLSRSGADVITATWAPRHRFGTDDVPVASVNFTVYRVTIVGSSTVTFDTMAPTFTYDASALGASVTVSVSAINRITGAGPATSGSV